MKDPKTCSHSKRIGDNYGESCLECGAAVSGYGYWAEGSKVCMHRFFNTGDGYEQCIFCETTRPAISIQISTTKGGTMEPPG